MQPVPYIIMHQLLRRQALSLPGVGTFRVAMHSAVADERGLISAPVYEVMFEADDRSAKPIYDLISTYCGNEDPLQAEAVYNHWLASAMTDEGTVIIENVAEIDPAAARVVLSAGFQDMLNPAAGSKVAGIVRAQPRKRLRPPRKNNMGEMATIIIIGGILAFLYILYYLATRTDLLDHFSSIGR